MKLTFSNKMLGLVVLLQVFMLAVAGFSYKTMTGTIDAEEAFITKNVKTLATVLELKIAMLSARRYEKDFLLRREPKAVAANDRATATMKLKIGELAALQKESGVRNTEASRDNLLAHTDQYSKLFHQVAKAYAKKGGTDEGIIGKFRISVHALEALFKKAKLGHLTAELLMLRRHEKDYLLRGKRKYVKKVEAQVATLHASVSSLPNAVATVATKAQISALLDDYLAGFHAVVQIDDEITGITADFRDAVKQMEPVIAVKEASTKKSVGQQLTETKRDASEALWATLLVTAAFLFIGLVAGILVLRNIRSSIRYVSDSLQGIAEGEGDLSKEITVDTQDEFGDLAHWFNRFVSQIRVIIGDVRTTADQIAMGSSQVSDTGQALAQNTTRSAASIAQITNAIDKLSGQTKTNAENASEANGLSSEVSEEAQRGAQHMEEMVVAVEEINESSKSISKIIRTIDEIAFQTNLLALNAAVEAARAGSHGKGFAVVAEEVRSLAARSSKAAVETSQLIEESMKKAERGAEITNMTARSLGGIVDGIAKVSSIVNEMTDASATQAEDLLLLSSAVADIDNVIQQNTASSEESAAASDDLATQAGHLRTMMARFVLSAGDRAGGGASQASSSPSSPLGAAAMGSSAISMSASDFGVSATASSDYDEGEYGFDDSLSGSPSSSLSSSASSEDIISLDDDTFGF